MKSDRLGPQRSLAGSGGQLWRASTGWKLALAGATICTGLYLLNPPWQWHKPPVVANPPPQQSAPVQSAAPPSPVPMPVARPQPRAQHDRRPAPAGMTSQIAIADENCGTGGPMHEALTPPPAIPGRVVGFVPSEIAMAMIPRSEAGANGKLDPAYVHNLRALFHPYDAAPFVRMPVVVPADMNVYVGEDVQMVGGHASPSLACHYVPNLIVTAGPQGG